MQSISSAFFLRDFTDNSAVCSESAFDFCRRSNQHLVQTIITCSSPCVGTFLRLFGPIIPPMNYRGCHPKFPNHLLVVLLGRWRIVSDLSYLQTWSSLEKAVIHHVLKVVSVVAFLPSFQGVSEYKMDL